MHYINAWLKRCVFNLDLTRKSVSEPQTLSGRQFQSLGAKYEKSSTSFSGLCYPRYYQESRVFCDLREQVGLQRDRILVRNAGAKPFGAL